MRLAADLAADVPWPEQTGDGRDPEALIEGVPLVALADRYGTPWQVISETGIRERARACRSAFPDPSIAYAAEAFLCAPRRAG